MAFTAIESQRRIKIAHNQFKSKFTEGTQVILPENRTLWNPRLSIWGYVSVLPGRNGDGHRYWNAFGMRPENPFQNIVVEINPPWTGINRGTQGLFATSENGDIWLLHKGGLFTDHGRISLEEFCQSSARQAVGVTFSDGQNTNYFTVANLNSDSLDLQNQIASFVKDCQIAKLLKSVDNDPEIVQQEKSLDETERNFPESYGSYIVGAQSEKTVQREHGKIWKSLVTYLRNNNIKHSNQRVGRWGPDLRTISDRPVLFEIKLTISAPDLQRAVGQLFLYEKLLGKPHAKVLVLPEFIEGELARILKQLNIKTVKYHRYLNDTQTVNLQSEELDTILGIHD